MESILCTLSSAFSVEGRDTDYDRVNEVSHFSFVEPYWQISCRDEDDVA